MNTHAMKLLVAQQMKERMTAASYHRLARLARGPLADGRTGRAGSHPRRPRLLPRLRTANA